jgi:hypothetical protein
MHTKMLPETYNNVTNEMVKHEVKLIIMDGIGGSHYPSIYSIGQWFAPLANGTIYGWCGTERHSQQQQSPPPSPAPSMPQPPSPLDISLSSSSSSNDSDSETGKPQRPRRGVQRTQKLVDNSQTARELAAARSKPKRRRPGKKALAAAAEMSQLLDAYVPPPSSAVLLDK